MAGKATQREARTPCASLSASRTLSGVTLTDFGKDMLKSRLRGAAGQMDRQGAVIAVAPIPKITNLETCDGFARREA